METTSRQAENLVRTIDNVYAIHELTVEQAKALRVLRREIVASPWFADLVRDVTSQTGRRSVDALGRVLSLFGVGEIVEGRLK